ncbi:MAG: hypothetical protein KDA75_09980 [Planctomycetaceae bacterium]|nr:hypothetical protein [Planctomycetaceae bacterium]
MKKRLADKGMLGSESVQWQINNNARKQARGLAEYRDIMRDQIIVSVISTIISWTCASSDGFTIRIG